MTINEIRESLQDAATALDGAIDVAKPGVTVGMMAGNYVVAVVLDVDHPEYAQRRAALWDSLKSSGIIDSTP